MHPYISILFLLSFITVLTSCMPEENLPIRNVGDAPKYFMECYCVPGKPFTLCATTVLPVSENLEIDFSKKINVKIHTDKDIHLVHAMYTLPGSDFIYNYGSREHFQPEGLDSLYLFITTPEGKQINASTSIPPPVNIYNSDLKENSVFIRFYSSRIPEENYYIYAAEAFRNDSIISKGICYLDYSDYNNGRLVEKSLILSKIDQAEKIICSLKRITQTNYDYQISLNAANSANQSSITTPVPLKGNLNGALGIFSCYTEDQTEIKDFSIKMKSEK